MTMRTYKLLSALAIAVMLNALLLVGSLTLGSSDTLDVGVYTVKLMYDFETPRELVQNQALLQEVLCSEEFERLQLDEPNRTVNAYYKFKYSKSQVIVEDSSPGFVLYRLLNDNIDYNTLWVFRYSVNSDGKLCDISEYQFYGDYSSEEVV